MTGPSVDNRDQIANLRRFSEELQWFSEYIDALADWKPKPAELQRDYWTTYPLDLQSYVFLKPELIANGHELALKAHTLYVIAERHMTFLYEYIHDPEDKTVNVIDVCKTFNDFMSHTQQRVGSALQYLAGEMVTEFEKAGISTGLVPLPKRCQEVYETIEATNGKGQAIKGREIIEELDRQAREVGEDHPSLEQGTLTRNIIPVLKNLRGVLNQPGAGYYIPGIHDPTFRT